MIVVDSREASKHPSILKALERCGEVEVRALEIGDFMLIGEEQVIVVERKDVMDFLHSMTSGRLWQQAKALSSLPPDASGVLILEGWLGKITKYSKMNPSAITRALDTLTFSFGIPILPTANITWTVAWLTTKAKALTTKEKRPTPTFIKPKTQTPREAALTIIEALPGISATLARRLLQHFKTPLNIILNIDKITQVRGIGPKTQKQIQQALNYEWRE